MNITQGIWEAQRDELNNEYDVLANYPLSKQEDMIEAVACCDGPNQEENAQLIAEAGTVTNETGYSPRQLADQKADLLAACEELVEVCSYVQDAGDDDDITLKDAIKQGHAAMSKATN